MAFGTKTNERPGTRAVARHVRMSASKARVVLDLIRGLPTDDAHDVLEFSDRAAADVIAKCLDSAIANAEHNDELDPESLHVAACFADEGKTLYRFRPRARGRATRIRKRTCHITIIVSPMPADMLARFQARQEHIPGSRAARRRGQQEAEARRRRVAASQGEDLDEELDETHEDAPEAEEAVDATAAMADGEELEVEGDHEVADEPDVATTDEADTKEAEATADEAESIETAEGSADVDEDSSDAAEAEGGAAADAGADADGQAGDATEEPSGRSDEDEDGDEK